MPAGIAIYNDAGTILLDDTYGNCAVASKGTVVLDSTGHAAITIPNCISPFIAVATTSMVTVMPQRMNGTDFPVSFYGPSGASVEWFCFDQINTAPSTYGLVVYRSNGSVAFDALRKYASLVSLQTGTLAVQQSFTSPAGRKYAVAIFKLGVYMEAVYTPDPGSGYYTMHTRRDASAVQQLGSTTTINYTRETGPESGPVVSTPKQELNSPDWVIGILDVTTY